MLSLVCLSLVLPSKIYVHLYQLLNTFVAEPVSELRVYKTMLENTRYKPSLLEGHVDSLTISLQNLWAPCFSAHCLAANCQYLTGCRTFIFTSWLKTDTGNVSSSSIWYAAKNPGTVGSIDAIKERASSYILDGKSSSDSFFPIMLAITWYGVRDSRNRLLMPSLLWLELSHLS